MVSLPNHDAESMARGNIRRTIIVFSIINACLLAACGPEPAADVDFKYFLDFRSEDFYLYDNTYRFTAEKSAADVQSEPEYFRVHIDKTTRRFFMIEYIRDGDPAAVYLFDDRGRITKQDENGQVIAWSYMPDRKTAEISVDRKITGRNVFEYRDGTLRRMLMYDEKGALLRTVPLEEQPDAFFSQGDENNLDRPEPETGKRFRMEAEEMLELGR
jgi:hypothetical protein